MLHGIDKCTENRLRTRFEKGSVPDKAGAGRPVVIAPSRERQRTQVSKFDKNLCVFCQSTQPNADLLHAVTSGCMGFKIRQIAQNTDDDAIRSRLSDLIATTDPLQAVALVVKYHLECFVMQKRRVERKLNLADDRQSGATKNLADAQLLDAVRTDTVYRRKVLNMNDINVTYANILEENGFVANEPPQYKKYLKDLISANLPDVKFNKAPQGNKPELFMSARSPDACEMQLQERLPILSV